MTVTRRILLQIAAAAGFVILVASGVTYRLVYGAAERQAIAHLSDYVAERARVEEANLLRVQENLELVRLQVLRRFPQEIPANYQEQWDRWFEKYPDGAWRSKREFSDGRKFSTMWLHKDAVLTPEVQTQILRANNICNDLLPGWVDSFPSLYFVFPFGCNIGFDPRIPNWVWETPADYDNNAIEAIATSNPENNPSRRIVWNSVLAEPTTGIPSIAVTLPVYLQDRHIATIGHDIHVLKLVADSTRSGLSGVTHCIFRADGRLIAHRSLMPRILESAGRLTMEESGDAMLRSVFNETRDNGARQLSGFDESSGSYFAVSRLAGPEWFFLTSTPAAQLRQQAFASARWVLWSGLLSLALVLTGFAIILRRQIARPLADLARATTQMSAGDAAARATVHREDELGVLAGSFNEMSARVASRDAELRQLNQDLEATVERRTAELREVNRDLEQAREDAERALAAERELNELKSNFVSMVSHEFRTPLGVILSAADVLDRYFDRLDPADRAEHLEMIQRSTRNLAHLMEEVLLLGKVEEGRMKFAPQPVDIAALAERLVDEVCSATSAACPIRLQTRDDLAGAVSDEALLRHIFINLLSNAVKYSEPGSEVEFLIERRNGDAHFTVRDRGIGISAEDQARLFHSFTRGANVGLRPGTGLGLVIVQRCVQLHGGKLELVSAPGEGTTVAVTLPLFPPLPTT